MHVQPNHQDVVVEKQGTHSPMRAAQRLGLLASAVCLPVPHARSPTSPVSVVFCQDAHGPMRA